MSEAKPDHKTTNTPESRKSLKNKCLNERRRRDQENLYFEELAELISASITDMNSFSVKPEKCAILQESLNQIKQIKQEAGSEAVQQSQVSSSKPSVLANNILGPLLLEALDGFLFVVNSQGKVEFVSENVTAYLKYAEDDLVGKSIYNIIHVGDHAQFSNSLLPMSLGSVVPWPSDAAAKGRTFNCRMLVKPPCEETDDVEIKQTYVSQYENMQISAILQPGEKIAETSDNTCTDGQSCLVCIARRISLSENTNTMLGIEQFTTKQDLNGKIIAHDTSGIAHSHYNCPNFIGQNLQDFCHTNDVQTLSKHIQEVLKSGNNTSSVYRFKLQDNRYVFVQTKSQLFPNRNNGEAEYVLSTHSIIRECDSDIELKGSASTSLMKSIIGQSPLSNNTQRSNPQIAGIPNSISTMLGTINNFMNSSNSGILAPPEENLENITDPFNSTNSWDNAFVSSDAMTTLGSNGNFPMSIVSSTTSNVNSWNNMGQIKPPPPQMPPASQQRPMMSLQQQQQMSTLLEKQRQQPSSMNFQRSNSFESGGQKSPRFSPSPSTKGSPFQMPNQRMAAMMGYPSQRSPGSSNNMGQNRMSPAGVAYPVQRTPPMSSSHQSGNLTQSQQVYLRLHQQQMQRAQEFSSGATTMSSQPQNPLQALQCMDNRQTSNLLSTSNHMSQSPRLSSEFTFPLSSDTQMTVDKRTNHRAGKLCQLLTQTSSSSDFDIYSRSSSVDSNASASASKAGVDNFVLKSPADSGNQSPTPGPGQSPQDKPQSTTHNDEGDHSSSKPLKEPKTNNVILKQLLSQEEDVEDQGTNTADVKEDGAIEMDKNEAEAKKSSNVLLKQLLSEDHGEHEEHDGEKVKGKQRKISGELLQILLNEQEENCTSAPAESTSQDTDSSSRQRHQSGPQEPQSTTMTPMTPVTPLTPLTPLTPQSLPLPPSTPTGPSQVGQPLRSQTPQQGISFSPAQSATSSSSLPKGSQSGTDQNAKKLATDTSALIKDKNLDNLLNYIWEKGNEDNTSSKTLKRKAPPSDIDSASDAESDILSANNMHSLSQPQHLLQTISQQDQQPQQPLQPQGHSSLIQKNALLAKLLSKKNAKETKIFTQLTVSQSNPCENPQQRFPKNLSERLLVLKPNKKQDKDSVQERKDSKMDTSVSSGKLESMKDKSLASLAPMQGLNGGLNTSNSVQGGGMANLGTQGLATNQQQFQEQYEQLQQLLSGTISTTNQQQAMNMDVDQVTGDSSDSLLDQILQQAADLQQDINKGNIQQISSGTTTPNNNLSDEMIISQLEQVLGGSEFPELDSGMSDMMAIEAIQKQLMSEEPVQSSVINGSTAQPTSALNQTFPAQQTSGALLQSQGFNQNLMAQQQNQQMTKMSTSMDLNFQLRQMGPPGQPQTPTLSPQQPFSQAAATNFGPQGPRLPAPQGSHTSALAGGQQRQMFSNPSSTAIQVRQSLLQQQKLKQMREVEKQRQERQRLLVQRQLNQQFNQRFPQNMDNQVQAFPENLGDLMNSGSAPNVTIQRNQIPGPMSPRFAQGGLQQLLGSNNNQLSQQTNLNQILGPSTPNPGQMSPHFNQPQTPSQWARQQGSMGMPQTAGGQFNINRHRSLSGGSIPSPGQQSRFQFPDSQFNGNQSSGSTMQGMYNQSQSQQMFNQNRMMQRQMSMPQGRGSPRTPHSPYGNSPDPLLMSPHSMSPNNNLRQQQQTSQVSPPFNQSSMPSASGNFTQSVASMPGMNSQTQSIGSQGFQGFDLQQQLSELESKKIENLGLGMAPSSTSQYVKQELRNICSARSEKQLQQHQQQHQALQQQVSQNASSLAPPPQQPQKETYESEIPLDIFEQINEMAKEHGVNPGHPGTSLDLDDFKEEDVLKQKRQEAKHIYEQFQALAKVEKPEPAEENPEVKATKLFRTQLLTPQQQQQQQQQQQAMMRAGKPEAMQIQVVQKEPRSSVEDMKPADHKNSLLQQLLSE